MSWFKWTRQEDIKLNAFKKWANPGLFCLFSFFSNTNITEKTVGISRIRTQIARVEGEHADHLTTATAKDTICYFYGKASKQLPLNLEW